ncbi:hypothetical protein WN51_03235 [Melipona quadrifasciata]|uniref:Uncharacterized protein n=1 Tax=Melipona quadrifasciata TaxID=166423 RepID=A0A0N0U4A7_9HYME|nr:hypothetical protein WN51_03235 [Melipona quadrifasciata]
MALLSNHHEYPVPTDVVTTTYSTTTRTYDALYPSPYNSPSYESVKIPYGENCAHKGELTPRKEAETIGYGKEVVAKYSRTPDSYERSSFSVLTPVTPQRYEPQRAINHTASPGTVLHEDNSVEYHPPAYCYETPPQEQKFQILEGGKPMQMAIEQRRNCWEPVTSAQIFRFLDLREFLQKQVSPTSSPRRGRRRSRDIPPSPSVLKRRRLAANARERRRMKRCFRQAARSCAEPRRGSQAQQVRDVANGANLHRGPLRPPRETRRQVAMSQLSDHK